MAENRLKHPNGTPQTSSHETPDSPNESQNSNASSESPKQSPDSLNSAQKSPESPSKNPDTLQSSPSNDEKSSSAESKEAKEKIRWDTLDLD